MDGTKNIYKKKSNQNTKNHPSTIYRPSIDHLSLMKHEKPCKTIGKPMILIILRPSTIYRPSIDHHKPYET